MALWIVNDLLRVIASAEHVLEHCVQTEDQEALVTRDEKLQQFVRGGPKVE